MNDSSPSLENQARDASLLLRVALADVAGAAIVLDERLDIVDYTAEAEQLVGPALKRGLSAPDVLCGAGTERPVAEALAAGRPVAATIMHPIGERGICRCEHYRCADTTRRSVGCFCWNMTRFRRSFRTHRSKYAACSRATKA